MTLKYFNVKNGLSTGNIRLDAGNSNVTANFFIGNISVSNTANLGNVANVKLGGGSASQYLQTDGAGNLTWATITGAVAGSNSQVIFNDAGSFAGNESLTFDKTTGTLTANSLSTSGSGGNISGANYVIANFFVGDGSLLTNVPGSELSNLANFANSANFATLANIANSANIANIANLANIVSSSSQPNITSIGNLVSLTVDGQVNLGSIANIHIDGGSNGYILQTDGTGNLSWVVNSGSASLQLPDVSVDNFTADGSNNSFELSTTPDNKDYLIINIDGVLQLSNSYTLTGNAVAFGSTPLEDSLIEIKTLVPGAGGSGSGASANTIFNGSSNVKVYANSNVAISSNGTANIVVVSSSDITIAGNLLPNANVTYDIGSPSNSFRDLYLSGSTIYFGGATIKADSLTGAIALIPQPTANTPNPTGIVITASGTLSTITSVNGEVTTSNIANAASNSSSSSTLTGIKTTGVVDFIGTSNVSLGNIANIHISGGNANAVIKTDGSGNLSWGTASSTMTYVKEYVWRGQLTENVGSLRHYIHATTTLVGIYAYLAGAGLTQSTAIVKKNGTSINTITIPANTSNVSQSGLSISLSAGDYLTVDITQGSSASDLYINFVYQG